MDVKITGGADQLWAQLDTIPPKLHIALLKTLTRIALKTEARVKQKLSGEVLHVRRGRLRNSIHSKVTDNGNLLEAQVFSTGGTGAREPPYARILEYGGQTRPHVIVPVKAKALHFFMGTKEVFAKIVHHPGSKIPARSYIGSTFEEIRPTAIADIEKTIKETLK